MGILGDIANAVGEHEHEEHREAFQRGYEHAREEARAEVAALLSQIREHVHALHELLERAGS